MCNTLCKKNVMYITINNHDDRNIGDFSVYFTHDNYDKSID